MNTPIIRYFSLPNGSKIMSLRESTLRAGLKAASTALKAERRGDISVERWAMKIQRTDIRKWAMLPISRDVRCAVWSGTGRTKTLAVYAPGVTVNNGHQGVCLDVRPILHIPGWDIVHVPDPYGADQ